MSVKRKPKMKSRPKKIEIFIPGPVRGAVGFRFGAVPARVESMTVIDAATNIATTYRAIGSAPPKNGRPIASGAMKHR